MANRLTRKTVAPVLYRYRALPRNFNWLRAFFPVVAGDFQILRGTNLTKNLRCLDFQNRLLSFIPRRWPCEARDVRCCPYPWRMMEMTPNTPLHPRGAEWRK